MVPRPLAAARAIRCYLAQLSSCLLTRQQVLKMGYFYWLRVKSSNHLQTDLSRGYLK